MKAAAVFQAAHGQGHDWIAARVPHQGAMCLLDRVESASAQAIRCHARSHRDAANPLRQHGRLGAACGVEYAAQAMALHGALAAQAEGRRAPAMGFLVSVRQLLLHVTRLDDLAGDLCVRAETEADNGDHSVYAFALSDDGGRPLLAGRAIVMLDAPASLAFV